MRDFHSAGSPKVLMVDIFNRYNSDDCCVFRDFVSNNRIDKTAKVWNEVELVCTYGYGMDYIIILFRHRRTHMETKVINLMFSWVCQIKPSMSQWDKDNNAKSLFPQLECKSSCTYVIMLLSHH